MEKHICEGKDYNGFRYQRCDKNATVLQNSRWFCKAHSREIRYENEQEVVMEKHKHDCDTCAYDGSKSGEYCGSCDGMGTEEEMTSHISDKNKKLLDWLEKWKLSGNESDEWWDEFEQVLDEHRHPCKYCKYKKYFEALENPQMDETSIMPEGEK